MAFLPSIVSQQCITVYKSDFSCRATPPLPQPLTMKLWCEKDSLSQTFVLIAKIYIKLVPHIPPLLTVLTDKKGASYRREYVYSNCRLRKV